MATPARPMLLRLSKPSYRPTALIPSSTSTSTAPCLPSGVLTQSTPRFQQCRHESTTRRHKKLLYVPPAPSYTPASGPEPTLIYNPPSAAPSIVHTPLKFLPEGDKRRELYEKASALARSASIAATGTPLSTSLSASRIPSSTNTSATSTSLPPPVRTPYTKTYHLSPAQMDQIRELRAKDPDTWTRNRLAEKFGCSSFFVGLIAPNPEKGKQHDENIRRARERWGKRRREARWEMVERKKLWGRDA